LITSIPRQKITGCSALLGYLAPTAYIQAERASMLCEYAWEWDTSAKTLVSRLSTFFFLKEKRIVNNLRENKPKKTKNLKTQRTTS